MTNLSWRRSSSPTTFSAGSSLATSRHCRRSTIPANAFRRARWGDDYYAFLDLGSGRVGFVLADVAGKGVAAALLMANLPGSLHNRADCRASDLSAILAAVNGHFYEHTEAHRYATVFFGCYDDHTHCLAYLNC